MKRNAKNPLTHKDRRHIKIAMREYGFHLGKTADVLGISMAALRYRLRKLGLEDWKNAAILYKQEVFAAYHQEKMK